MQIAFLTLFLGLVSGAVRVDLDLHLQGGAPAAVELLLDGQPAGRLEGPPWSATVDLGPGLVPRRLVARALGPEGAELARTEQWINVPRSDAEVNIAIERDAEGRPAAARLSWESLVGTPMQVHLTMDGVRLPVEGGRAVLPPFAPEEVRVLVAEVRFPEGVSARREAVVGGLFGSEVRTELTAVPVRVPRGFRPPPPARLAGWLRAGDRPLAPVALERGPAQVVVVRDLEQWEALRRLQRLAKPADDVRLAPSLALRFVWPSPRLLRGAALTSENFAASRWFTGNDGGWHRLLTSVAYPVPLPTDPSRRWSDAVAVAALEAAATNRRRAVVLVLGADYADASRFDPAAVRRFLDAIGVPLHVWSLVPPDELPPAAAAWGKPVKASSAFELRRAARRLHADLETQRIVWVDGRYLPQEVTVSRTAPVARIGR